MLMTEEKGIELYNKIKERFKECNFNIVKWRTSDNALRKRINSKESNLGNIIVESGKILGVLWDEKNDIFVLIVKELFENGKNVNPTKRNVLKALASIYDPVGRIYTAVSYKIQNIVSTNLFITHRLGRLYWLS